MGKDNNKIVTFGSKGNKKDISKEPETKELKRMIRTGELDQQRAIDHLKEDKQHKKAL